MKIMYSPAYSMRFFRKNDEVSAFRPLVRFAFELVSLFTVTSLVVDRFRDGFNLIDGVRVSVDRLPLIIEIEDELNSSILRRLMRDAFVKSVDVCNE